LPRRLVERHAARFALAVVGLPLKRKSDLIQAVVTKAAIMDAGIAWLMELIVEWVGPGQNLRNTSPLLHAHSVLLWVLVVRKRNLIWS
jgi:hypothetical protein